MNMVGAPRGFHPQESGITLPEVEQPWKAGSGLHKAERARTAIMTQTGSRRDCPPDAEVFGAHVVSRPALVEEKDRCTSARSPMT